MTLRFSLNNVYSAVNTVNYYLWEIYRFMTAVSPAGPGWVSIGESNGTTGGMGTTGIITSATSLISTTAWFVLRSPDSKIQILFARGIVNSFAGFYLTYQQFSGGSSTTFPSYNINSTLDFSNEASHINTGSSKYSIHLMADDAYPYGFYAVNLNISSAPIVNGSIHYIPMDDFHPSDGYNYCFVRGSWGNPITVTNISNNSNGVYGSKSFNKNGLTRNSIGSYTYATPICTYYGATGGGIIYPNNGMVSSSNIYLMPLLFCNYAYYKGLSYKYYWNSNSVITQGTTVVNRSGIRFGDLICPWDGITDPVLV
jgi:hypothetical protein